MKQDSKRSIRSDSTKGKAAAVKSAVEPVLSPPSHIKLRDADLPFWESIIRARARDTWTDVDLAKAANLARCQADIERIQSEIDAETDIVINSRGTQIVNPKHSLLETLTRRELALSRAVHVHAEATTGKSEDAAKKLQVEREAVKSVTAVEGDGLIPGVGGHTLQ